MSEKPNIAERLWDKYNKFVKVLAVLGTLAASVEIIVLGVRFWDDWNDLKELVEHDKKVDERLNKVEDYIFDKKSSYAVGFRVKKEQDSDSGGVVKVKQYRDWLGKYHNIYLDVDNTEFFGIDHYYYIDKKTGEKIYCW